MITPDGLAAALRKVLRQSRVTNQIVAERTQVGIKTWLRYTQQSGIAHSERRGVILARNLSFLARLRATLGISIDDLLDMALEISQSPSQPGEEPGCDSRGESPDPPASSEI